MDSVLLNYEKRQKRRLRYLGKIVNESSAEDSAWCWTVRGEKEDNKAC